MARPSTAILGSAQNNTPQSCRIGGLRWDLLCGSDRLIQVLFCKFDACKYPLTKAGATPDGPEFASSRRIFRLVSPAGAGMTNSVAGTIRFPTNRRCRLAPAHQGMKIRAGRTSPGFPLSRE